MEVSLFYPKNHIPETGIFMEITRARDNDLIELLYLLKVCISDMHSKGLKHWNNAYPDVEMVKEDIRKGSVYLLREHRVCKGTMTLSESIPDTYFQVKWPDGSVKPLYLQRMAIHPKWQGLGLAGQLIGFAGDYAKKNGYQCIRLDVFGWSEDARRFYEKHDFLEIGAFHMDEQKVPYVCYEKQL